MGAVVQGEWEESPNSEGVVARERTIMAAQSAQITGKFPKGKTGMVWNRKRGTGTGGHLGCSYEGKAEASGWERCGRSLSGQTGNGASQKPQSYLKTSGRVWPQMSHFLVFPIK